MSFEQCYIATLQVFLLCSVKQLSVSVRAVDFEDRHRWGDSRLAGYHECRLDHGRYVLLCGRLSNDKCEIVYVSLGDTYRYVAIISESVWDHTESQDAHQ